MLKEKQNEQAVGLILIGVLRDFDIIAEIVSVDTGPTVLRFELQLLQGTRIAKVTNIIKDLAREMAVPSLRLITNVEGEATVAVEVPRRIREFVQLNDLLQAQAFNKTKSPLRVALGLNNQRNPEVIDLTTLPHLLLAGAPGTGKSFALDALLVSLLTKSSPEQLRLFIIDSKGWQFPIYNPLPHLYLPAVHDFDKAEGVLQWCVEEIERRFALLQSKGARSLDDYNRKRNDNLPRIVVIIDDYADLIMAKGPRIETIVSVITIRARLVGVHLVLATERPLPTVISRTLKTCIPARVAFQTTSRSDSHIILDQRGAEGLLGHGDMLYLATGKSQTVRIQGASITDEQIENIVEYWASKEASDVA